MDDRNFELERKKYEKLNSEIEHLFSMYGYDNRDLFDLGVIFSNAVEAFENDSKDLVQVGDYKILKSDVEKFKELMNKFALDYGDEYSDTKGEPSDGGDSDSSADGDSDSSADGDSDSESPEEEEEQEEKSEIAKIEELIEKSTNLTEEEKMNLLKEKDNLLAEYKMKIEELRKLSAEGKKEDGLTFVNDLKDVHSMSDGLDNNKVLFEYLNSIRGVSADASSLIGIINVSMDSDNSDNLVQIGNYYIIESRVYDFVKLMNRLDLNVVSDIDFCNSRNEELNNLETEIEKYEKLVENCNAILEDYNRDFQEGKISLDMFKDKSIRLKENLNIYQQHLNNLNRQAKFVDIEREFLDNAKINFVCDSDDELKNTQELANFLVVNKKHYNKFSAYGTLLSIIKISLESDNKSELVSVGNYKIIDSRKDEFVSLMSRLGLSLGKGDYKSKIEKLEKNISQLKDKIGEIDNLLNNKNLIEIRDAYYKIIDDVVKNIKNDSSLDEFSDEELKAKVDEMVKNHADYSKLNNWENPIKLVNELKDDVLNKVKGKDIVRNEGKNEKLWLKALAGVTGLVTGVGLSVGVAALSSVSPAAALIVGGALTAYSGARMLYQGSKLACSIITKINKGNEPKIITGIKAKIPQKLKNVASKAFDKPRNPYAKWFVNGVSLGYMFGNVTGLDEKIVGALKTEPAPVSTVDSSNSYSSKTDWSEYDYDISNTTSTPTYQPKVNWSQYDYDVTGLSVTDKLKGDINLRELGFDSIFRNSDNSSWSEALKMAKDGAARLEREYINPRTGERWYHFLQQNGAGYGWLPADAVDQAIADSIVNTVGGRTL